MAHRSLLNHSPPPASALALALVLAGCGAAAGSASGGTSLPARQVVVERLERRLQTDPNAALCQRLAQALASGDHDALRPLFDFPSFVERIVAHGGVPAHLAAELRAAPSGPENFARFLSPQGSRFRCLGTRTFLGEPHLAIRHWTDTRFDYVLVHLTGHEALPIDDYHVVSSGHLHSEAQAIFLDPRNAPAMDAVARMFEQSYREDFTGIIAAFRALPEPVQASPVAFHHFINAVFSSEPTGSPVYREALERLEVVLRGREHALAYWRLLDARRRGDPEAVHAALGQLVELLDDYELLEG